MIRPNAELIRGKSKIRLSVGGDDSPRPNNQAPHEFLEQLKIEHEWEVVPGVPHNANLFYRAVGERAFAWFTASHRWPD